MRPPTRGDYKTYFRNTFQRQIEFFVRFNFTNFLFERQDKQEFGGKTKLLSVKYRL